MENKIQSKEHKKLGQKQVSKVTMHYLGPFIEKTNSDGLSRYAEILERWTLIAYKPPKSWHGCCLLLRLAKLREGL